MDNSSDTTIDPEQVKQNKALLRRILYSLGAALFLVGAFLLAKPEVLEDMIGVGTTEAKVFGAVVMMMGVSDFLIARFIFNGKDRR